MASLLIIIAAILWALDGLLRRTLYGLPPATLIFFEHIVGLALITPFVLRHLCELRLTRKQWGALSYVSLFSWVIGTLLFTMALGAVNYIPYSIAILIQKFQPIFAIGFASIVRHERIPRRSIAFIILALIAGYFVTFPHGVAATPEWQKEIFAALCALGSAAAWGTSSTFSKYLLDAHKTEVVTFLRFLMTAAVLSLGLLIIPSWHDAFRMPTGTEWTYLFLIALSTGLVAMYIYYRGLRDVPVHVSAILELTWPIVAVLVDYLVYGTVFTPLQYLAMAILIGSMYMVTHIAHRHMKSRDLPLPEKIIE